MIELLELRLGAGRFVLPARSVRSVRELLPDEAPPSLSRALGMGDAPCTRVLLIDPGDRAWGAEHVVGMIRVDESELLPLPRWVRAQARVSALAVLSDGTALSIDLDGLDADHGGPL